ncbi:MAG: hypothetical protein JRN62_03520 [Nitrososphaerota archaeon]|nr:hypothetical protein [Nitrososphaerota archaeon]MDG6948670.1 hypothetical protein [Nitrososphaerota archaeon]
MPRYQESTHRVEGEECKECGKKTVYSTLVSDTESLRAVESYECKSCGAEWY